MKKRSKITICILIFLILTVNLGLKWAASNYDIASFEQLIFYLNVPLEGANTEIIWNFLKEVLLPSLLILFFLIFLSSKSCLKPAIIKIECNIFNIKKSFEINFIKFLSFISIVLVLFSLLFSCYRIASKLGMLEWIKLQQDSSTFIEDHYVDPSKVKLTFPDKKRNLIYIYLESMENIYMLPENGGANDVNVMPNLTNLAKNNISFSNSSLIGGPFSLSGTTWTMGAITAYSSGLPLKVPSGIRNEMSDFSSFLPKITTMGEILKNNGYNNMFLIGSDKTFGGRNLYLESHGDYNIIDYVKLKEEGFIPDDYFVWWGMEDKKLFEYAKSKLTELSSNNELFNFSILTVDTHFADGYLDKTCETPYDIKFDNVLLCSDKLINDFISWVQAQPFYENTTIVLAGDHLTMDGVYINKYDKNFPRTVYNAFINSAITADNTKNRLFSTLDMFPTTLASIGVEIENDRLGLGTNMFSNSKTLLELYPNMQDEMRKNSDFYNNLLK